MWKVLLGAVLVLGLAMGCDGAPKTPTGGAGSAGPGSGEPMPADPEVTRGVVGTEGGVIAPSGGAAAGVTVDIPPGALAEPVEITVEAGDPVALEEGVSAGPAIQLGPSGLMFLQPVTVTLPLDAANRSPRALGDLVVAVRDDVTGGVGINVASGVDRALAVMTTETMHFSTFQALDVGTTGHGGLQPQLATAAQSSTLRLDDSRVTAAQSSASRSFRLTSSFTAGAP